jgi:hypothetical protein
MAIIATGIRFEETERRRVRWPVAIGGAGQTIAVNWAAAAGATKVVVDSAAATIGAATATENHADLPARKDGNGWIVDLPAGRRLSGLTLVGFKPAGGDELVSSVPGDGHITIAFPAQKGGGFDSPRFAVPALDGHGAIPPILAGASFYDRVLRLDPPVDAGRVRIALVTGNDPPSFDEQDTELSTVHARTDTPPRNARLAGPDGAVVWQTPLFEPDAPDATADFRAPLEAALGAKLTAKSPLNVSFTLSADGPAEAYLTVAGPSGALLRIEKDVLHIALEGDPVALPLAAPIAPETPAVVTGDVSLRYTGLRLLETVSDRGPAAGTPLAGAIVGADGATRALPLEALAGCRPARVGVYGRAPVDTELSIEFVRLAGNQPAQAVAPPAVVAVAAGDAFATHWGVVAKDTVVSGASGIRVRANRGRFFWADNGSGAGLVRIAIVDPDPGGRALQIGGGTLLAVSKPRSAQKNLSFPAASFAGAAPFLESDLFLTLDIADLTLRYRR